MKILLYGINYAPELTGIGKYSGEMAEWLAQQGHEVRVVCAPPYYPQWQIAEGYRVFAYAKDSLEGVTVWRCPLYVPKKPKTLSRLAHLFSFALSSFPLVLAHWRWKPDVVLTIEPTFFCAPAALLLARLSGAQSVLHVQDYELDAMLSLGMGKEGLLALLAQRVERFMMRRFSAVSSISHSMLKRAAAKIGRPSQLILFPNWVDVDFVTPMADATYFRQLWDIPVSTKVVLYSGNMGKKQGLEMVLQAASAFKLGTDVLFVFVGAGAKDAALKRQAHDSGLQNTRFFPLQAYEKLPALMALADVHLVVQKKGVADAVLPSKLTTILSAGGQALITAEHNTELGILCDRFPDVAYRIDPEDLSAFIAALRKLLDRIDVNRRRYNRAARDFAERYLAKQAVLHDVEQKLSDL
ncbi:MAG: WcaI family glycosyltransferase [Gammaproteobacteria bacterium]